MLSYILVLLGRDYNFNLVLVLITKISKLLLKALLVLVNHLFREIQY